MWEQIIFSSAHLSFLDIIIALRRLSVSHSLGEETYRDRLIPLLSALRAYQLSMATVTAIFHLVNNSWANRRVVLRFSSRTVRSVMLLFV